MSDTAQKKILLVDDDSSIRELFGEKLAMENFLIAYATNGFQGYEMARRVKPDLIIMDVMMPELDGIGALDKIKSDDEIKNIPVIFFTSIDDRPEDVKAAKEAGATDYINKGIDMNEFIKKINSILG